MNAKDLELKISGLEKAIKEQQESADQYKVELANTMKKLEDYNKPEITPMMMDEIHSAVEKAVEGFDFEDTAQYEFEFGMDYDGKVHVESVGLQAAYELTDQIVTKVCNLFKEAECPEDEPTADQINRTV